MAAIIEPNTFAKNMESNTKRLIQRKRPQYDASMSQRKLRKSLFPSLHPKCEKVGHVENPESPAATPASQRLCGEIGDNRTNSQLRWRSPIGTFADHRMTNNNRIHKQWHIFAVILLSLIICLVQVTVTNGHPDPVPTPIRVSHSYTKTVSNTIPTSTTSRSTTQITSFLPSDAISSLSSSFINYKNYNAFANNRSSSSSTGSIYSYMPTNVTSAIRNAININSNANMRPSSRRSTSTVASRKVFSPSPATSIDRPFYTKLTSNDAVSTPTHYKHRNKLNNKKAKKSKNSSKSSSTYGKYSKTKGSKERIPSSGSSSVEEFDNDEYAFMPSTTEKSYHPPKLSLEPFFNFLTSLATASREVIMSKEQHHHAHHQSDHNVGSSTTTGAGSKYSASYDTINQSMREGAKKSKKSKKGNEKSKKKGKGHAKSSKKGSKGKGGKRHRIKSIESLEDEDELDVDPGSDGPIPVSLPNPIIDSAEESDASDDDDPAYGIDSSGGLHILDVLRTPMIPDYESPLPAVRAEPLVAFDVSEGSNSATTSSSNNSFSIHALQNVPSNSSSSTSFSGNPPSARANLNKGQGYLGFDNYEGSGTNNVNGSSSGNSIPKSQREKQRSERDPMDSFHEQQTSDGTDLTAQESISNVQVVPNPYGMKMKPDTSGGFAPSQYQYQQKQQQQYGSNKQNSELSVASSQQVSLPQSNSPEYATAGKSSVPSSADANSYRPKPNGNGKNDFVSKYPTTFVYQSNSHSAGPPPPGPRPYTNPTQPGLSSNNPAVYDSLPAHLSSSRTPFRINKLRPNLHSYYDTSYHHYAGVGESQVASEMIGIRHPYGPPHFKPPPHSMHSPYPLPSPPRFVNGYGNRPGFMMPHRGTHYVGHTLNNVAPSLAPSREPSAKPYEDTNNDYPQDFTGNGNSNNENSSVGNQDISGADATGSASDNIDLYPLSELDDNSVTTAENSETKKVGIMDSFDLFYKEYKILTWVAVFFCTSMALLTLLVYLYINNPPTEVVQARQLFPWTDLLKNPQITRFLSNLAESSGGNRKRKKDSSPANDDYDEMGYLKPYGYGFGGKSGKQTRKQTRSQQDRSKFFQRATNKLKQRNDTGGSGSGGDKNTTSVLTDNKMMNTKIMSR